MLILPISALPEYHDDMLVVKVRSSAGPLAVAAAGMDGTTALAEAPGLSTLSLYERAGMIKRVIPLTQRAGARSRKTVSSTAAMAGVAAVAVTPGEDDAVLNAGVMLIELQPGKGVEELQMALAHDATVEYVSKVPIRYLMLPAGDTMTPTALPPSGDTLWNLRRVQWGAARQAGLRSAADVRVAILDTGMDVQHPDVPQPLGYVYSYGLPGAAVSDSDIVGHGTHVAGTICALINNEVGINGICECTPRCYKIFSDDVKYLPHLNYFAFLVDPVLYRSALADCLEEEIRVLNLSIGGYGAPDPQELALFEALIDSGCTIVAAMGNDNTGIPSYPAAIAGVVAVGATSFDDTRAPFSNFGDHIALAAPGVGIWSTVPTYPGRRGNLAAFSPAGLRVPGQPILRETHYAAWQGTSMATPHVTAAAALLIARHGTMPAADVRAHLLHATDRVQGMGTQSFTAEYGTGRLNLAKLV